MKGEGWGMRENKNRGDGKIWLDRLRAGRNCGGTAFAAKHMKTTELDSSSSAGRTVSHDGCCRPLERRRFMRRAGAASLAMLAMPLGAVPTTQATQTHCPRHGSGPCQYMQRIHVVFDSCAVAMDVLPRDERFERCGRIFYGKMTVTVVTNCRTGTWTTEEYPVQSGGYLHSGGSGTVIPDPSDDPEGTDNFETDENRTGNDTSCPAGDFLTSRTPTTGSLRAGNSSHRYNVTDTGVREIGERTGIQIHMPGASTGCIAFRDTKNDLTVPEKERVGGWETLLEFEQLMAESAGCIHLIDGVPTRVVYKVLGDDEVEGTGDDIWPIGNRGGGVDGGRLIEAVSPPP